MNIVFGVSLMMFFNAKIVNINNFLVVIRNCLKIGKHNLKSNKIFGNLIANLKIFGKFYNFKH